MPTLFLPSESTSALCPPASSSVRTGGRALRDEADGLTSDDRTEAGIAGGWASEVEDEAEISSIDADGMEAEEDIAKGVLGAGAGVYEVGCWLKARQGREGRC